MELLDVIGFTEAEKEEYAACYAVIGTEAEVLAARYVAEELSLEEAQKALHESLPDKIPAPTADLLLAVAACRHMEAAYEERGLSRSLFVEAARDIRYKMTECETYRGLLGLQNVKWFGGFFKLTRFAFGRLQFDVITTEKELAAGDRRLAAGSFALKCHIPSAGPLRHELCLDSYRRAYEHFRDRLAGEPLAVICQSWLLYPPYRAVFGENTNRFAADFTICSTCERETFHDSWRVFNRPYEGDLSGFAQETSLQRRFVAYIRAGGGFGDALGLIFFDGDRVIS